MEINDYSNLNIDIINAIIDNIFNFLNQYIEAHIHDDKIIILFSIIFNISFKLKILLNSIIMMIQNNKVYRKLYQIQVDKIINEINIYPIYDINDQISYLYRSKNNIKYTYSNQSLRSLQSINLQIVNINNKSNLSIDSIDTLINIKLNDLIPKTNIENVDIGFGNKYKLQSFNNINENIPFNTLVFVKNIKQVVMKVGDLNNFKFINSKLYKVYSAKNKLNNERSIICNNNIKRYNKKCNNVDCLYFHDPILGYEDNYHSSRQFSNNPIVYNNSNFKSGDLVPTNIKNHTWIEAINLYQSSLSNILIACMHAESDI